MILVTGGAGYIGSHCVLNLIQQGIEVVIFDNLELGHLETVQTLQNLGKVHFEQGDLKIPQEIENIFDKYKIEAVMHFAAYSQVGESVQKPEKYHANNVNGSLNLLNAMVKNNINKIVFSSTAAVYGEPEYTPIDEKHPTNPINTYGQTKLAVENILDEYDEKHNLHSVRLRYFNVAGADSHKQIGEWHSHETHLIPNILKSTFKEADSFKLFGTDYPTKDGTCIRDYINVEDLADAHSLALKYLCNGGKTDIFNLGTTQGNSVKEVFETCETLTGQKIKVEMNPRRIGDPAVLVANNQKAKKILNWTPKKSLTDSVSTAYEWEKVLNQKESTIQI